MSSRTAPTAVTFENYRRFIDGVDADAHLFRGVQGYRTLKTATQVWLQHEAGVWRSTKDG